MANQRHGQIKIMTKFTALSLQLELRYCQPHPFRYSRADNPSLNYAANKSYQPQLCDITHESPRCTTHNLCYQFLQYYVLCNLRLTSKMATSNSYQKQIISHIKKSLIQEQTEDNNLGTLVVVVFDYLIRYIYVTKIHYDPMNPVFPKVALGVFQDPNFTTKWFSKTGPLLASPIQ